MASHIFETVPPIAPTTEDADRARESSRRLAPYLTARGGLRLQMIEEDRPGEVLDLPVSAIRLLARILAEMAQGNAVTLVPIHAELTTQQAADLLSVSRPYLVKLLNEGQIPHRTVGKFRRVRFDDLMAYKRKDDDARAKIADELTADAQELGMGY
jgi:excisionase family DNA binding protein